jgi:hypothetical protein
MAEQVIAFVTLDQAQTIVATSDLSDKGAWSSSGYYYPRDAVLFNAGYYACLKENTNKPPTLSPAEWLLLVFVQDGSSAHTADEAYALADSAYHLAVSGTNGIESAQALAYIALQTAWAGTNTASNAQSNASNALNVANQAYLIAISGTNGIEDTTDLAYRALQTAWSGTSGANSALAVAAVGTNAAAAANALALVALQTAWLGTASYSVESWGGTITVDLEGATYQRFPINGNTHVLVANPSIIRGVTAVLVESSGSSANLTFNPTDMAWFGAGMPTALAAGKRMIINFTSFGSTGTEIHAAYTQQT